jgi:hypothetical protein
MVTAAFATLPVGSGVRALLSQLQRRAGGRAMLSSPSLELWALGYELCSLSCSGVRGMSCALLAVARIVGTGV